MPARFYAFILCATLSVSAYADSKAVDEVKDLKVRDFFNKSNIDFEKFSTLSNESKMILTEGVEKDQAYLTEIIQTTEQLRTQQLLDPSLLVEAVEVKRELEQSFQANNLQEQLQIIDRSVAANADFPYVNASGNANSNVFAVQYIAYKEFPESSGSYKGYGLYMTIDISSIDGSVNASLPLLAATATVESKNFNSSAKLIGFEGVEAHELLQHAMPGSSFDINAFSGYNKFKQAVIDGLKSKKLKISPETIEPLQILSKFEGDSIALARIYALIQIAQGKSLANALENYKVQSNEAYAVIKTVYKDRASITKLNGKPKSRHRENTKLMLASIGVNP